MVSHTRSVGEVNGICHVVYLYRNGAKRNLNLNYWDDDWNANYRFLAVRHSRYFSPDTFWGVFSRSWRFHPPSILPASCM